MKKTIITLLAMIFAQIVFAQEDTLTKLEKFVLANPVSIGKDILSDGCNVRISANQSDLLLQLVLVKPEIQMDFLMRNWAVYIAPAGKKRKKYSVTLPSGFDVKEMMQQFAPQEENREDGRQPDLQPLIFALNNQGAIFDFTSDKFFLGQERFIISLDKENKTLVYSMLIPLKMITADKKIQSEWALGLSPALQMTPPPPSGGLQPGIMPPPPSQRQGIEYSTAQKWTSFNFDEVLN